MPGKNSSTAKCAKNEATIWVSVKQQSSAAGIGGANVTLTGPGSGGPSVTKPADASGLVKFDSLQPGKYSYSVALPANKANSFRLDAYSPALAVGRGDSAVGGAEAYPIGTLTVRVVDDGVPPQLVPGVVLSVAGAESSQRPSGAGTHSFIGVRAGAYTVSATADHLTRYAPRDAISASVVVPEGGIGAALVVLRTSNTATPVIDLVPAVAPRQPNEVWFVKAAHASAASAAGYTETPLELRFRYTEINAAKPFTGGGTVSWDASVTLFRDAAMTLPVVAPGHSLQLTHGELAGTLSLFVKGASAGNAGVLLALDQPPRASNVLITDAVRRAVVVQEVVLVEPKLELEYKVALFDRDLAQHQTANGEGPASHLRPQPTRIEISLQHSGSFPLFTKEGTLAAPNCAVFFDAACTVPLNRKLTRAELTATPPKSLYLRGTTRGLFNLTLTLDPSGDPRVIVAPPATQPMGVVELKLHFFKHDAAPTRVAATTYPLTGHCASLEAANLLPPQVLMTDADKVRVGRHLHLQQDGHFGRAKIVVKKLTGGEWPGGTTDYDIVLQHAGTGGLAAFDAETEGGEKALPLKIKVSKLLTADQTLWVEGSTVSPARLVTRLDLGLDRADGGLAKTEKLHGDWGRFSVVKIEAVEVATVAVPNQAVRWDAGSNRFYINFEAGDPGRKIKLRVRLSQAVRDVPIHFMLSPSKHNLKKKNWGVDLPGTWDWDTIDRSLKHRDKADPTHLLHLVQPTDAMGTAEMDVYLSRFAGDVYLPAAYTDQDPHLAAYVHGHATLAKRKPARADHTVTVWRKYWYQMTKAQGFNPPQPAKAVSAYEAIFTEMAHHTTVDLTVANSPPRTFYPKYMIDEKGGSSNDQVANMGSHNKNALSLLMPAATAAMPVKRHLMVCTYQRDQLERDDNTGLMTQQYGEGISAPVKKATVTTVRVDLDRLVLDPPLQGGSFVDELYWVRQSAPAVQNAIPPGNASVPNPRKHSGHISVTLPAIIPAPTSADPVFVVAKCLAPSRQFLGESFAVRHTMIVYDPKDVTDYNDTVTHEIGHSMNQTPRTGTQPDSPTIPDHPNMQDDGQGNHCRENDGAALFSGETKYKCVMYDAGPMKYGLHKFCPVCHPYLLVEDFHKP